MKRIRSTLIIDDNPADCYYCQLIFEPSGFFEEFHKVHTGSEAIELFEQPEKGRDLLGAGFPPDLVLLDINMPGIDGFEFLRRYRALSRELAPGPVIVMLTSSSDPRDRERAAELGVEHFVIKPPTEEDATRLAATFGQ